MCRPHTPTRPLTHFPASAATGIGFRCRGSGEHRRFETLAGPVTVTQCGLARQPGGAGRGLCSSTPSARTPPRALLRARLQQVPGDAWQWDGAASASAPSHCQGQTASPRQHSPRSPRHRGAAPPRARAVAGRPALGSSWPRARGARCRRWEGASWAPTLATPASPGITARCSAPSLR